jgi:hypothetical protein
MVYIALSLVFVLLTSCTAAQVAVAPDSSRIKTGTQPPNARYEELGAITATHGGGCGLYGTAGNYEGAYSIIRNKAAQLGADYVHLLRVTGPHMQGICAYKGYTIDGMAYRILAAAPSSTAAAQTLTIAPGSGLSGTFAGQISGIRGDRSFNMGVTFTVVQTEDKIAGAWTSTEGTSGTVTATVAGDALSNIRVRQLNPCEGDFAGIGSVEGGGLRLRGSYLGSACGSPVNASFIVNRER